MAWCCSVAGTRVPLVDLPNGLVSSLKDATLEAWVTWGGGNAWQRVFDFGDSTNATPENNPGQGKTYLFLTPGVGDGVVVGCYSLSGTPGEVHATAPGALSLSLNRVALVVSDSGDKLALHQWPKDGRRYLDGLALVDQRRERMARSQSILYEPQSLAPFFTNFVSTAQR